MYADDNVIFYMVIVWHKLLINLQIV